MPRSATALDVYVGSRIAARRAALGLSQTALAETIGVTFQQVQKYEGGTNRVSASRLHAIALALAAPITSFFPRVRPPDGPVSDGDLERPLDTGLHRILRFTEGRTIVEAFPRIADAATRKAVVRIIEALAAKA